MVWCLPVVFLGTKVDKITDDFVLVEVGEEDDDENGVVVLEVLASDVEEEVVASFTGKFIGDSLTTTSIFIGELVAATVDLVVGDVRREVLLSEELVCLTFSLVVVIGGMVSFVVAPLSFESN